MLYTSKTGYQNLQWVRMRFKFSTVTHALKKKTYTTQLQHIHTFLELMHLHDRCKPLQARHIKEKAPWQHILLSHIC